MSVNDEVMVRSIFVLAHTRVEQRGILHSGEAKCKVFTHRPEALGAYHPLACVRIKLRTASVVGYLEPMPRILRNKTPRNAVHETAAVIGPHRKLVLPKPVVARGCPEEKYLLFGRTNLVANSVWEKLSHPRSASKNVRISNQP